MNTLILNTENADFPIGQLVQQVQTGGIEVRDPEGNLVAFVLSPADHQAWVYAEARRDLEEHRDEIQRALARRGGITTPELLERAAAAQRAALQ